MRPCLTLIAGISASVAFSGAAFAAERSLSEYARGVKEYTFGVANAHVLSRYSYGELADCSLALHLTANRMLKSKGDAQNAAKMMAISGVFNVAANIRALKVDPTAEIPFLISLRDWIVTQDGDFDSILIAKVTECEDLLAATSVEASEKVFGAKN